MQGRWWHEDHLTLRLPNLKVRGKAKRALSAWFDDQGFIEVETPALQILPGMEAHLAAFRTHLVPAGHYGIAKAQTTPLYLHTSPEVTMKKLLAGGMQKIWQLCPVYRNAEGSSLHSPEFQMLEWYRTYSGYQQLIFDSHSMFQTIAEACEVDILKNGERSCSIETPFTILTVEQAFEAFCRHNLTATLSENPLDPPAAPLREAASRLGIYTAQDDRFDDIFFRLMETCIEPRLGENAVCALVDYPISMAALARPKPDDPLWAERVELYACGIELANGFGELTDPIEQRRRFKTEMDLKQSLYAESYPVDEDFIEAVGKMPPASGMALGFDRLVMLLTGAERIEDVLWALAAR
jgi:lysyl-tRNA synthetase class 2